MKTEEEIKREIKRLNQWIKEKPFENALPATYATIKTLEWVLESEVKE